MIRNIVTHPSFWITLIPGSAVVVVEGVVVGGVVVGGSVVAGVGIVGGMGVVLNVARVVGGFKVVVFGAMTGGSVV